jgi:hypothetical protein
MKIDWQRAALNIRQAGISLQSASLQIGRHKGYLAQLARGEVSSVEFVDGLNILNLHLDVAPDKHEELRT